MQVDIMRQVCQIADACGGRAFLVGGAIRDYLVTGTFPNDLDFTVCDVSAEHVSKITAERLHGSYVLLDEFFGIHRVVLKTSGDCLTLDISDAQDNALERDLARRDFTVNAMAFDPLDGSFLDPFHGQADLLQRRLRMVSETNMREDPLRMLRAFRFQAQLTDLEKSAEIEPETLAAIIRHCSLIRTVAGERIHQEFLKLLSAPVAFPALLEMAKCGVLEEILPELTPTRQVPPNSHHHLGLFDHTLELVRQAELLLPAFPEQARQHILTSFKPNVTRFGLIKLACLLHDIGKAETMVEKETGRVTFYGHDKLSETMTAEIAKRWKLGRDVSEFVKKLVRWHLYPCQFGRDSSRKSVLRFFRRMESETPDVILLALADRFSTKGPDITPEILEKANDDHLWLVSQYYAEQPTLSLPKLLNGHDIMALLHLPPGPQIKTILEAVQEASQLGEIQNSEEARRWVLQHYI